MSGAEAVRKEFEAVAEDILDSAYDSLISHGQRKAEIISKLQASRSAAIQECAAIADYEHGKAAGWEEQTDSNAAWYVKVTCERIEAAILALKER